MPKSSPHVIWSEAAHHYHLSPLAETNISRTFVKTDEQTWFAWLVGQTAFSFQGPSGHLYAVKEARERGAGYWYAYRTRGQRTTKRYLGKTNTLTLARLEEVAALLADATQPRAQVFGESDPQASEIAFAALPSSNTEPSGQMLLLPKLGAPRLPTMLVERARLLAELDRAWTYPLTLLSASAGFGKTTVISAWAAHQHRPIAWVSLEEEENDAQRFWSYVIAALRTATPGVGGTALSMLRSPQPPVLTTILTALLNDLTAVPEEGMLILDDFHVIDDPAILTSFNFFLEHLPPRLHLILAGRTDPPLALSRWRASGQMMELRDRDLRFTHAETVSFLAKATDAHLTEAEVDMLEQRTEGWIAGLQLAVLALRKRADSSTFVQHLSGSQRFILDYMQEEVLERQPQKVQDFLLHTAILTRLNASLCQAVTAGASEQESQLMLLTLEKANLFLVPLDEERRWYRLHSLFRDVLQARLQVLSPELGPVLHQRAARWYIQQENTHEAITHALAGNDYAFAANVMEQSAEQLCLDGEAAQLHAWIKCLPDAVLLAHARMALTTVLQLLFSAYPASNDLWEQAVSRAEQITARIEPLVGVQEAAALSEAEAHVLQNRLGLLRYWIADRASLGQEDDAEERRRLGSRMQALARDEEIVWKMLPTFMLFSASEDIVALIPLFAELKRQAEREQHPYEAAWLGVLSGLAYRQAGQPQQAYQLNQEALQHLKQLGKARSMFGNVHLHLADLYWGWNQLAEARTCIETALQFAQTWQNSDMMLGGYSRLIPVLLAQGKQIEAAQVLRELERLFQQNQWAYARFWMSAAQAQIWLAQGNLSAAASWAAQQEIDLPQLSRLDSFAIERRGYLILARILLACKRNTEALSKLSQLLPFAEQRQQTWIIVQILVLQVVALHASGENIQARQVALRLLHLGEPADHLRVYLDAGQPMRQVLQSLLDTSSPESEGSGRVLRHISILLKAFEQEAVPASNQGEMPLAPSITLSLPVVPAASLPEPLTAREREVLRLLASGATNQQIAEQLVIALSTAKKHVANILDKLGVENRVQAIAYAREYELL